MGNANVNLYLMDKIAIINCVIIIAMEMAYAKMEPVFVNNSILD